MRNILLLITWFIASTTLSVAQERNDDSNSKPFEIGDSTISSGKSWQGSLKIPRGNKNIDSFIPITVHHGINSGPVLSLIAGIHGSEYAPILAMQDLAPLIDPTELSGTLIIVHIANMPAFSGRTVYFGPNDLKNLNRSFPGKADGTITERIAHTLTEEVIKRSDYLVDIHSGDGNESLRPSYSAYYAEAGGEEVVNQSKRIAVAFGLETIVQFAGSYDSIEKAIYTSAQAVTLGIPSIDIESGELASSDSKFIKPIINGSINIMRELKMIEGEPDLPVNPSFISNRTRIYSDHNGIFYADSKVQTGDYVSRGTELGIIKDFHGNDLEIISAPASGILLILFGTPPVNKGDNIVVIGKVPESKKD